MTTRMTVPGHIDPYLRRALRHLESQISSSGATGLGLYAENKDTVAIPRGGIVANHSSGVGIQRAVATSTSYPAIGLAAEAIAVGNVGEIQTEGLIESSDWSLVTGTVALAAKATYFLDSTSGKLTTTAPSTTGYIVQIVGVAVNTTTLDITIYEYIRRG